MGKTNYINDCVNDYVKSTTKYLNELKRRHNIKENVIITVLFILCAIMLAFFFQRATNNTTTICKDLTPNYVSYFSAENSVDIYYSNKSNLEGNFSTISSDYLNPYVVFGLICDSTNEKTDSVPQNVFSTINNNNTIYCIKSDTVTSKSNKSVNKSNKSNSKKQVNNKRCDKINIKKDVSIYYSSKSNFESKIKVKKQSGLASHMGHSLQGRLQANGEKHNKNSLICAHKSYPFGTKLLVTNKDNNKSVVVVVTDRGPFKPGRIVDLSLAAAKKIDIEHSGVANVDIKVIE